MQNNAASTTAEIAVTPWSWIPDQSAWYDSLADPLIQWMPHEALGLDAASLKMALADAIDARSRWLNHPCLSTLTTRRGVQTLARDFQLTVWTAAHSDATLGEVHIPEAMPYWTPAGDATAAPGTYPLNIFAEQVRNSKSPCALELDIWCRTMGYPLPDTWADLSDDEVGARQQQLSSDVISFFRTVTALSAQMPMFMDWLLQGTQVVTPMAGAPGGLFRSGSTNTLPGLIYCDLFGGAPQILEALAHETAHRHLFMAEAYDPLIEPEHQGRYHSPLRPEPRPLRGILLACHALAYICAAFIDSQQAAPDLTPRIEATLEDLRLRMDEAEDTLVTNRQYLTAWGNDFLDRTREVCTYARA